VTPLDYDYLRKCLKQRSGLVLTADKQYLVESRLLPVARKVGLVNLTALVNQLKRGDELLMTAVVEAMATNESFFFRDKVPFYHFTSIIMPALIAARRSTCRRHENQAEHEVDARGRNACGPSGSDHVTLRRRCLGAGIVNLLRVTRKPAGFSCVTDR